MSVLIRFEDVFKTFFVKKRIRSLKKSLFNFFREKNGSTQQINALCNIDIEMKSGEVWGIIGHNGAGKTTLLKIISQIYAPTTGKVECNGKVAALMGFELGFFSQLSGRENIRLFGSIFNIPSNIIDREMDKIIEFSGLSEFIDIPIHFYSTGMSSRLSFAAFSLLEPEILLIDDIFQAGDLDFQTKSMSSIQKLISKSSTALFVSHNLHLIKAHCDKAILLEKGKIIASGKAVDIVNQYLLSKGEHLHGTTF